MPFQGMRAFKRLARQAWRPGKRLVYSGLRAMGFLALLRAWNRRRLLVVLYHGVYDDRKADPSPFDRLHVPRTAFYQQVHWLRRHYTLVSLRQVIAWLNDEAPLPPRAALITFDDGYRNNFEIAWPILAELRIPAVLFLPTGFLGTNRFYWTEEVERRLRFTPASAVTLPDGARFPLQNAAERRAAFKEICDQLKVLSPAERERVWAALAAQLPLPSGPLAPQTGRLSWEEAEKLARAGAEIGAHGVGHTPLIQLGLDDAFEEILLSKQELERRLGGSVTSLAYPNGDYDSALSDLALRAGYTCAFTTRPLLNHKGTDRYALGRVPVNSSDSFVEFVANVSGMPQFWALGQKSIRRQRILQIGNYPPPLCGWAIQTRLLAEELRRRGHGCRVLNINENRRKKSPEYVDVQNGLDYLGKLFRFAWAGYRFHMHVNAESPKGYLLAASALGLARLVGRPAALTFHGGLPQTYFPRPPGDPVRWAFRLLFRLAGRLTCDSAEIKQAIESYGLEPERVAAIPCFSAECLEYHAVPLAEEIETFLKAHDPVFFCYLSFRPEYRLPVLREAMARFRKKHPAAGFLWLGFPAKELPAAQDFVRDAPPEEAASLLLLGNLPHDEFLTLLRRCFACIRTPACDGVSASVLESLALGVPVVASENGRRPPGVLTYVEEEAADLCGQLQYLVDNYSQVRTRTLLETAENNTARMADWLVEESRAQAAQELVHAD